MLIHRTTVVLATIALVGFALPTAFAADAPAAKRAPIYHETADAKADIAKAVERAKRDNMRVLIVYGANWCGWCYKLDEFLQKDAKVAPVVRAEYVVVHVDMDKDRNKDVRDAYGVTLQGVPYLTILDADGKVLINHDTGSLETGPNHDAAKVLPLLEKYKAEPRDAEKKLADALAGAKADGKRVFLRFGAPWCGWCHKLDDFLARPEIAAALSPHLVLLKVDVSRDTNGEAVQRRYQSGGGGIPWFAVLDTDGRAVADSGQGASNIGYPVDPHEIAGFMKMLKTSAPSMTPEQLTLVERTLGETADAIRQARARTANNP